MTSHTIALHQISRAMALLVLLSGTICLAQEAMTPAQPLAEKEIRTAITRAYAACRDVREGANADYIPALAEVDPELFGIAVVTVDGQTVTVGDVEHLFSIQSISKVFTMATVMNDMGEDAIVEKIGVNATGRPFNSIQAIEDIEERSVNPCVNAGAIATTSLMAGSTAEQKWQRVLESLGAFAGRDLEIDQQVYVSETETNQRNQAIAMLLQAYGRIYSDPEEAVDVYTRQCSIAVNAKDLATMSATLANQGRNPLTGQQVIDGKLTPKVLAVMATAGLYDDSGLWLYRVGLPAKSGVGGGIIAVAPGKFGIAAFSPRLDEAGNSVRAQKAIEMIARDLHASVFLQAQDAGHQMMHDEMEAEAEGEPRRPREPLVPHH